MKLLIRTGLPAPWHWRSGGQNKFEKIVITGTKEPSKHAEVHAKSIPVPAKTHEGTQRLDTARLFWRGAEGPPQSHVTRREGRFGHRRMAPHVCPSLPGAEHSGFRVSSVNAVLVRRVAAMFRDPRQNQSAAISRSRSCKNDPEDRAQRVAVSATGGREVTHSNRPPW